MTTEAVPTGKMLVTHDLVPCCNAMHRLEGYDEEGSNPAYWAPRITVYASGTDLEGELPGAYLAGEGTFPVQVRYCPFCGAKLEIVTGEEPETFEVEAVASRGRGPGYRVVHQSGRICYPEHDRTFISLELAQEHQKMLEEKFPGWRGGMLRIVKEG